MRIVIAGGGTIGFITAEYLSHENHDVIIIEKNPRVIETILNRLDVSVIQGSATNMQVLHEAGIEQADMFLALTDNDQANIISCALAKNFRVPLKVARLNEKFKIAKEKTRWLKDMGIDEIIDTEELIIDEIVKLVSLPGSSQIFYFLNDEWAINVFSFSRKSIYYGKSLKNIQFAFPCLPLAYSKASDIRPYDSEETINEFLYVYFACEKRYLTKLQQALDSHATKVENLMIFGKGYKSLHTSCRLAEQLKKQNICHTSVVISDQEKAHKLSELYQVPILCGDPSETQFVKSEKINQYDGFIAMSHNFEKNLFSCCLAYQQGLPVTVSLVRSPEHAGFISTIPLTSFLNPALTTANKIMQHTSNDNVLSRTILSYKQIECLEIKLRKSVKVVGKKIDQLALKNSKIIALKRENKYVDLSKNPILKEGDTLLLFLFENEKKFLKSFM